MSRQAQEVTAEWSVPKSPEALGFCLAEAAHELTGRPIAVVVRDSVMNAATIVATSTGADRRLLGVRIAPGSAIGRACVGGVRTHGSTASELFGERRRDRRERESEGVALPIGGEANSVGALVILGALSRDSVIFVSCVQVIECALFPPRQTTTSERGGTIWAQSARLASTAGVFPGLT